MLLCSHLHLFNGKPLQDVEEEELTAEEVKERKIMKLLLKVKNGTPPQRKSALRQLTDKARDFGAGPLFNQILPLLMSPTLEDQERHLLVKVRLPHRFSILLHAPVLPLLFFDTLSKHSVSKHACRFSCFSLQTRSTHSTALVH